MLRIPQDNTLAEWARELADECMASARDRAAYYAAAQSYYDRGTDTAADAALVNATKPQIERLAGFLYASYDVRFRLTFNSRVPPEMLARAQRMSEVLTKEYGRSDADLAFGEAVKMGCIKGASFLKHRPDGAGVTVDVVDPACIGVLRESLGDLESQEAICHVSYPTLSELWSIAGGGDRGTEVVNQVRMAAEAEEQDDDSGGAYYRQIIIGSEDPLGEPNGTTSATAITGLLSNSPRATTPAKGRRVVKLCELWIPDPDRDGDYSTIQLVYPGVVIDGEIQRRNLLGVKGRHPFTLVQPRKTPGYLFGRSIIEDIAPLQDALNEKLRGIQRRWRRNDDPPTLLTGFSGLTPESYDKITEDGGFLVDQSPAAKAQRLTEPVSPQDMEEVGWLLQSIDRALGFAPVLQGQGESGVRAQGHAETLVRTASPPLLRMAARTERQLADSGYLSFRLMQENDAKVYEGAGNEQVLLSQIDPEFGVEVDAHSASPAFADMAQQKVMMLAQAKAIGAEDLIELLHPPHTDLLIARLHERQAAEAKAAQAQQAAEAAGAAHHAPHKR